MLIKMQHWKRLLLICLGLCLSLTIAPLTPAQTDPAIREAKVKEIIEGTEVFIQNQQAKVNDIAKMRQRVRTGNAKAELTFNNGVVARLSKNSILTVGQCARLQRGTMLVNGAVNGCTQSIVAAVRGTTYVLSVDEAGKQEITVLEGEVTVRKEPTPDFGEEIPMPKSKRIIQLAQFPQQTQPLPEPQRIDPPNTETRPVRPLDARPADPSQPVLTTTPVEEVILKGGDKLDIDSQGVFSAIRKLTQAEFEGLLQGALFEGFSEQLSSIGLIRQTFEGLFPGVRFPISIPSVPSIPGLPFF